MTIKFDVIDALKAMGIQLKTECSIKVNQSDMGIETELLAWANGKRFVTSFIVNPVELASTSTDVNILDRRFDDAMREMRALKMKIEGNE